MPLASIARRRVLRRHVGAVVCSGLLVSACSAADRTIAPLPDGHWPAAGRAPSELLLRAGDRLLLQCGKRYGPLRIRLDAANGVAVRIEPDQPCGQAARPIIDGRVTLHWQEPAQSEPQRWMARTPASVSLVFAGDQVLPRARFPARGYLILPGQGAVGSTQQLAPVQGLDLARLHGARVHARTREWLLEESNLVDSEGRLSEPLRYALQGRSGYYFTGKPWMFTGTQREWAYDNARGQLWVQSSSPPAGITASLSEHLVQVEGQGRLEVHGVHLVGAGADAFRAKVRGTVLLHGVGVRGAAGNGLAIIDATEVSIEASEVRDVANDAIFLESVGRAVVRDNRVENAGMLLAPGPALGAINAHGARSAVLIGNRVLRSAYIGVRFAGNALVQGNVVEDSCLVLSDCGAFYSWRRDHADRRGPVLLSGNAVLQVGQDADTTVKLGVNDWFAGIYLDEWTREVTLRDNLIVGAHQAIYLHNAFDNEVQGNWLIGSRVADQLDLVDAALRPELVRRPVEPANRLRGHAAIRPAAGFLLLREVARLPAGTRAGAVVAAHTGPGSLGNVPLPEGCEADGPAPSTGAVRAFVVFRCSAR